MLASLSAPIFLALADTAAAAAAPPITASATTKPADESCKKDSGNERQIVICAERPNGYRIDPSILEAERIRHSGGGGGPRPNSPTPRADCATVGPASCTQAGINLLAAVPTAIEMAHRLASGQEVGSMFKTTPTDSEYELYQAAKARREEEAAQKRAAEAKAKAQVAAAAAAASPPADPR